MNDLAHILPTARAPGKSKRTGKAELPADPGLERLLADKALSAAARLVAVTIVKHWAWYKPSCYPCNASIAERCGYSASHVGRCLLELERSAYIRRQLRPYQPRLIWLCWREAPTDNVDHVAPCEPADQGSAKLRREGSAKVRTLEPVVSVNQEIEPAKAERPERSRPEPAPSSTPSPTATEAAIGPQSAVPAAPEPEPAPPAPPAPEQEARTTLAPSPLTVQALPPSAETRPREAPRAILQAPAGPTPKAAPSPAPSPAKAGPAPVLTPEQKARLDALPEATANLVLTWLLTGDRILVAEARKKLAPPPRRPEAPRTLPEVLGRIREDPSFPSLAADWLASALQDRKSYSGFKARCEEAWRGELHPARLVSAYDQATGPKVRNRGALWQHCLRQRE